MGKKIVILNGSPRPQGNTMGLIEAFTQGAEQAGNSVVRMDLTKLGMHPCLGCNKGGLKSAGDTNPCVQEDGMAKVYPAYVEADVVVMASPLYSWSISAQLKCVLDRFYALGEGERPMGSGPEKSAVLLMAGASDKENRGPKAALAYYEVVCSGLKWKNKGAVYAKASALGDIQGNPELEAARALGASIR